MHWLNPACRHWFARWWRYPNSAHSEGVAALLEGEISGGGIFQDDVLLLLCRRKIFDEYEESQSGSVAAS